MPGSIRLRILGFKHREELVLAEFEKSVAFTFIELLEIENISVERDGLFYVADFDRDVIAAVNFNASPARIAHFFNCSRALINSALRPRTSFR